ncbi:MAG: SapC family protein [Magnetococcales bacterium]|nr:SapC family protein [Magnetococcales bacterium]
MAELLFYQQPVVLDRQHHRAWRIVRQEKPHDFAARTNSVLLTGAEFIEASREYAIFFARVGAKILPLVLLSPRDNENLFVGPDGIWDARYIPGFVRRYPFVLAGGEHDSELTVCIDAAYSGILSTGEGERFFDDQGQQSPWLQSAVRFLQLYQEWVRRTEIFVNRLTGMELFVGVTDRPELRGWGVPASGDLLIVDEQKLLELSKPQALELFRCGELAWVHAHLASLGNLGRLMELMARRTRGV